MNDKEILELLEAIEDEGFNDRGSQYQEDWQANVCPYCHKLELEHLSSCKLVEAMIELRKRIEESRKIKQT